MDSVRRQVNDAVVNLDINIPTAATKTGVGIGGAVASFLTLNEWVALFTLLYVMLQIGLLVPKYVQLYRAWRDGKTIKVDIHE